MCKIFASFFFPCNYFFFSNGGGTQTFHLRAANEVERQKWVTALELAKAKVKLVKHGLKPGLKNNYFIFFYIFCSFTLLVCGEKDCGKLKQWSRAGVACFWPLGAGAARKK